MNAPTLDPALAVPGLPVDAITPSPTNPRRTIDDAYLAELAESIRAHGVIQPITVRPNPDPRSAKLYEIVVGECRWRAAKLAGLSEIPGFWRELDDRQVLEIQVIENLQRRDIHPLEEAEGYQRLIERHGYTAEAIADKIGKSRSYVYARLKLTALHAPAREAFLAGKMAAETALLVARIPGETLQKKAVREITQDHRGEPMSFRAAKDHIRYHFTADLGGATFPLGDSDLVPAAGSCATCPKRSANSPELCADLDGADVCTDPACFDDKREARHLQLIAAAEARGVPVLRGEEAAQVAPNGNLWNLDKSRYVEPDDTAPGTGGKTYREVLGEDLPVAAIIEVGAGDGRRLVELAEPTALSAALQAAGIDAPPPDDRAERKAAARDEQAAKQAARVAETERRSGVLARILERLQKGLTPPQLPDIVPILAMAFLRRECSISYLSENEPWLGRWGIALPDEFDESSELARIAGEVRTWAPGRLLAFMLDEIVRYAELDDYQILDQRPDTLIELCGLLGLDDDGLADEFPDRHPLAAAASAEPETALPPTEAAPADGASTEAAPDDETIETDGETTAAEGETDRGNRASDTPTDETTPRPDHWPFPTYGGEPHPAQADEEAAGDWPQPNAHGVYADDKAEALRWRSGKVSVALFVLQIGRSMWVSSVAAQWKDGSFSEPLTMEHHFTQPTKQDALVACADRTMDRLLGPEDHGLTAAQKKSLRAWLTDLANVASGEAQ